MPARYVRASRVRGVAVPDEVEIEYFAAARELAGCAQERIGLPAARIEVALFRQLLAARHVRLAPLLARMRLAVNEELAPEPDVIRAGDRIAVLPPVAGGSSACALRQSPLSVDEAIASVRHPGAGAIALFLGVVRDHAGDKAVARLDYEAHVDLAERELARLLNEITEQWPGTRLCVLHRVGSLAVGELAVVVAASAAHRGEAFAACRAAIDRIKQSVPIWKKEWDPAGEAVWVNLDAG
jgi:molybdopterin converting factor subunit 1